MKPATILQVKYDLTSTQAEILLMLVNEQLVTADDIVDSGLTEYPRVAIQRLRDRIYDKGVEIMSQRALGYWLGKEQRDKLREDLKDEELALPGPED